MSSARLPLAARFAHGRFHYGWAILGVTFTTLLTAAATRATPGVFIVPFQQEFGWSRATISAAVSINLVLFGLMGPFAAALVEYLGARRTMMYAVTLVAIGVALTTLMTQSWQLMLLWGFVVGGGTGMTALALGATVINRWFTQSRGLAMGMLTASNATGQLIFLPLLAKIVEDHGWRTAALAVAGFGFLMLPLIGFVMRNHPSDIGLNRLGEPGVAAVPKKSGQNPAQMALSALKTGMRSRDFWLLFGTFFICGLSTNGLIGTHLIPACIDHGIPEVKAAGLLAIVGAFDFVGTLASGWLSDRWNNRMLLFWYYGLRGLSLLYLPFSFDLSFYGLSLFALFYGLDWVATVPPTVRLTADVFGRERAGVIFGWIFCGHQLGAATASLGAGIIRDDLGDYLFAFMIAGAFCLLASLMCLGIGRRRREAGPATAPGVA
jgi:sugar phosphate permease